MYSNSKQFTFSRVKNATIIKMFLLNYNSACDPPGLQHMPNTMLSYTTEKALYKVIYEIDGLTN